MHAMINQVEAQSYILNEQQSCFRAAHVAMIHNDAGRFNLKVLSTEDPVLCSWQRHLGQNVLSTSYRIIAMYVALKQLCCSCYDSWNINIK